MQLGITNAVAHAVPPQYIAFGLAGGLPYIGTAAATIYMAQQAGTATMGASCMLCTRYNAQLTDALSIDLASRIDPGVAITMLDHALNIQMTYGAVMLSFLGALHWGFEFASYGGSKGCVNLV